MNTATLPRLTSRGIELDTSTECFGEMRRSDDIADDYPALRERMNEDGYLFIPGYLERDNVIKARRSILEHIEKGGFLDPSHPLMDAVSKDGTPVPSMMSEMARPGTKLYDLLYEGRIMDFYKGFLGGTVRHFDFTWVRAVEPNVGTPAHCDIVYMGRGTKKLYTCWIPLGDVTHELGGLMILEKSHRHDHLNRNYGQRDVDSYCTNYADAPLIEAGKKQWQWNGYLTKNPATLREKLGGRWLTSEFKAGDFVTFGMFTVHGSTDNHTNCYRLSSDSRYQLASEPIDERWIGDKPIAHAMAGKRGRVC